LFVGVQFFVKAPSSALMTLAVVAITALWSMPPRISRSRLIFAFMLGGIAWGLVHFTLFEPPKLFLAKVRLAWQYQSYLGLAVGRLNFITTYALETARILKSLVINSWPALLILSLMMWRYRTASRPRETVLALWCWLATAAVAAVLVEKKYYLGGYTDNPVTRMLMGVYFFWALALLAIGFVISTKQGEQSGRVIWSQRRDLLVAGMLASIPYIGAFGTDTPYISHMLLLTLSPWFGLVIYLAAHVEEQGLPVRVPVQLALAGFAAAQLITGYLHAEYEAARGVLDQRHLTTVGDPASELLVDEETRDAIDALKTAAARCGLKRGDRILGYYQTPGIVYALGGRTLVFPAFTGLFGRIPPARMTAAAEGMLKHLPYDQAHNAFVMTRPVTVPGGLETPLPNLQEIGRKLPEDYVLCGEAVWPLTHSTIRLWKPIGP
jgi:hypothetical protein